VHLDERTCRGGVRVQPRVKNAKSKKRPTYANATFRIKAGKTKTVRAKLTKAGRRLMKKRKKARVQLVATIGKGKAARVFSAKLTLKRAR
jgi:hypothetical protein